MGRDRRHRSSKKEEETDTLKPNFEGRETMDELLALAQSPMDTEGVFETFREAQAEGSERAEVVPMLFDGEPRFPGPEVARRFFQNLFGLWELAQSGAPLPLAKDAKPARPRRERADPPKPFGDNGTPDEAFVQATQRFLETDEKTQMRLHHSFENRQDALLSALDDEALSDEGYMVARHLLFELFAMLELGLAPLPGMLGSARVGSVDSAVFGESTSRDDALPGALRSYVEEALAQASLAEAERPKVRSKVLQGAAGLWAAIKR